MSALMPTYTRLPLAFSRGAGAILWDQRGRRYLDGLSGIAVTNLGHCHPAITETIATQSSTLVHTSNLFRIPAQERLAAELTSATGMDSSFFCNSGAEANEAAIKLARRYGHQRGAKIPSIIVLESAFHGRTMGALAATAGHIMQADFEPMLPGFIRVPREDLSALKALTDNTDICAILVEPVQGEGGVRPLAEQYLRELRNLCDQQQWLLMFDEVQSGNGRCGALYAFQRLGVAPDVLTTAKGLGNGFPIGVCLAKGNAAEVLGAGHHGTTFGGSPLACAVASTVINILSSETLWSQADPIRQAILTAFEAELEDASVVTDIRGLGLMIGIETALPTDGLVQRALDRGIIVNVTAGNTIRLLPPLVMSLDEAGELGAGVAQVLNQTTRDTP